MASCSALIQFVTSSDVAALKARLNPYVVALQAAATGCNTIDPGTVAALNAFIASWNDYNTSDNGFWTAGSEFNTGCDYEQTIKDWQTTLTGINCANVGPLVTSSDPVSVLGTAIKWGAYGLVAAGVLFALAPFIETGVESKAAGFAVDRAKKSAAATKRLYTKARAKRAAA